MTRPPPGSRDPEIRCFGPPWWPSRRRTGNAHGAGKPRESPDPDELHPAAANEGPDQDVHDADGETDAEQFGGLDVARPENHAGRARRIVRQAAEQVADEPEHQGG